jgi:hypothetical protein
MIGGNELFGLLVLGTNSCYYWIEYLLRSLKVMKWEMRHIIFPVNTTVTKHLTHLWKRCIRYYCCLADYQCDVIVIYSVYLYFHIYLSCKNRKLKKKHLGELYIVYPFLHKNTYKKTTMHHCTRDQKKNLIIRSCIVIFWTTRDHPRVFLWCLCCYAF